MIVSNVDGLEVPEGESYVSRDFRLPVPDRSPVLIPEEVDDVDKLQSHHHKHGIADISVDLVLQSCMRKNAATISVATYQP